MTSFKSSPVVTALWESVEQRWSEPAVHEAFLQGCIEENDLAFAARMYREQKEGAASHRHELAEAQLTKITGMAFAHMAAHRTPPKESKRAVTILAALVSGALMLACIYLLSL